MQFFSPFLSFYVFIGGGGGGQLFLLFQNLNPRFKPNKFTYKWNENNRIKNASLGKENIVDEERETEGKKRLRAWKRQREKFVSAKV